MPYRLSFGICHVRVYSLCGRLRIEIQQLALAVYREQVSLLSHGQSGAESQIVVKKHILGDHVQTGGPVVCLQIQILPRSRNDMPDLVAGKVILAVGCDKCFQRVAVPYVQTVHGTYVQVSERVLIYGADGIVRHALL